MCLYSVSTRDCGWQLNNNSNTLGMQVVKVPTKDQACNQAFPRTEVETCCVNAVLYTSGGLILCSHVSITNAWEPDP